MKKEKLSKKPSGLRIAAFAVIAVMMFALLGTGLYFILKPKNEGSGKETVVIDDVNTEVIDEINNQIVYASSSDMQTHYNAAGDYTITYSSKKFSVYDSNTVTSIIPRSTTYVVGNSFTAHYYPNDEATTIEEVFATISEKYSFVTDLSVTDEGEDSGLSFKKYSYSDKDLITDTEETVNLTVYVKSLENKGFAVLEIVEDNSTEKTSTYLPSFIEILETLDLHPEDLNQNSVYIQESAGLQVTYDVKKWKMESSTSSIVNFMYISSGLDESESFDYNYPTLVMSTALNSGLESEEDINNSLTRYITGKSELKEGLTVLDEGKKTLGNVEFSYVSYKYTNEEDTIAVIGTHYEGYNSANDAYISITTEVPDLDCDAVDAFDTLFGSIKASPVATGTDENVLGTSTVEFDKAAIIGKPAVVHIFNKSCAKVKFNTLTGFPKTSGKTFSICMAGTGSGSFINKEGYVLTNAHVANNNPIDIYLEGVEQALYLLNEGYDFGGIDKDGLLENLTTDIVYQLLAEYPNLDLESEYNLQYIYDYLENLLYSLPLTEDGKEVATISSGESSSYVQKDKPFEVDYKSYDLANKYDMYATELVKYNEISSVYEIAYKLQSGIEAGEEIADLALLKIVDSDVEEFYSINIEDPDLISSGQSILVIGFPGVVEDVAFFSESATTIPTITKGAISAIKPSFDESFELLQIDASVSGGNSGGPIFNSEGSQIGVVTYGVGVDTNSGGDYNAGISIKEVISFLEDAGVDNQASPAVDLVKSGLDDLSVNYYSRAVEKFTQASGTNDDLADLLSPLIKIANQKVEDGEDETPILEFAGIALQKSDMIIVVVVGGIVGLGIIILIILLILRSRRNKKAVSSDKDSAGGSPAKVVVESPVAKPTTLETSAPELSKSYSPIEKEKIAPEGSSDVTTQTDEKVIKEESSHYPAYQLVIDENVHVEEPLPVMMPVEETVPVDVVSTVSEQNVTRQVNDDKSSVIAAKRDSFIDAMLENDLAGLESQNEDVADPAKEEPAPTHTDLKVGSQTATVTKPVSNDSVSLPPDLM